MLAVPKVRYFGTHPCIQIMILYAPGTRGQEFESSQSNPPLAAALQCKETRAVRGWTGRNLYQEEGSGKNSRGAQDSNRPPPGNACTTDAIPGNAGNCNVCGKTDNEDWNYRNTLYINNNKHAQRRVWHIKVPTRTPVISVNNM